MQNATDQSHKFWVGVLRNTGLYCLIASVAMLIFGLNSSPVEKADLLRQLELFQTAGNVEFYTFVFFMFFGGVLILWSLRKKSQ